VESGSGDEVETAVEGRPADAAGWHGDAGSPHVGRYVVLELLGAGGMGRVLRAYDPKLQREVALKDVGGRDVPEEATNRMVAEARAMAKLSHPNVVTVHDVEAVDAASDFGPLVLVMEFVAGTTLQAWLIEQERTWREIVARYVDAGRGLAAAHDAGLLHRDFKPANVMIGHDGAVKVTDFGLAKFERDAEPPHQTPMPSGDPEDSISDIVRQPTRTGVVMGSPRYMAPEQHQGRPLTVAADQYSFCVALWEALAGEPPFIGTTMTALLAAKLDGSPKWNGPTIPRRIVEALGRGLAPKPEDRFASLDALLTVLVADPARVRRTAVGVACVAAIAIGGASWGTHADDEICSGAEAALGDAWTADRAAEVEAVFEASALPYAPQAWASTRDALDEFRSEWLTMHRQACEATAVRREQSAAVLDLRMACLARARVGLEAVVETLAAANGETIERAQDLVGQLARLSRCSDLEALRAEMAPPSPDDAEAVATARRELAAAKAANVAGNTDRAEQALRAAQAALEGIDYPPVSTELDLISAAILEDEGKLVQAEARMKAALERALAHGLDGQALEASTTLMLFVADVQERPNDALAYREVASAFANGSDADQASFQHNLAGVYGNLGRFEEAEAAQRKALALFRSAFGPDDLDVVAAMNNIATMQYQQDRYALAESGVREVIAMRTRLLGAEHPLTARTRGNLAVILQEQGKLGEAEREVDRQLEVLGRLFKPTHPEILRGRTNHASILEDLGRAEEARHERQDVLVSLEATYGPDHPSAVEQLRHLSLSYRESADFERAFTLALDAVERHERRNGTGNAEAALLRINVVDLLILLERFEEAETHSSRAFEVAKSWIEPETQRMAVVLYNRALSLAKVGRFSEAENLYRRAVPLMASFGPEGQAEGRYRLAEVLLASGRVQEAVTEAEAAFALVAGEAGASRAEAGFVLAQTLWPDLRRRKRARELLDGALEDLRDASPFAARIGVAIKAWRREHE